MPSALLALLLASLAGPAVAQTPEDGSLAGAVLDAAALTISAIEEAQPGMQALVLRAGNMALRHIADFFGVTYNPDPHFPADPIGVSRAEFDAAARRSRSRSGSPT